MCMLFAGQAPESYAFKTRSFRLRGHVTSLRLEAAFWDILHEIAAHQGMSLPKFLTELHDEVLELHGEVENFSSLLRCSCLKYLAEVRGNPKAAPRPRAEPRRHEHAARGGARILHGSSELLPAGHEPALEGGRA